MSLSIKYLTILYCKYSKYPDNYSTMMKYFNNNQDIYDQHVKMLTEPYNGFFDKYIGRSLNDDKFIVELTHKDYIWCRHDDAYKTAKYNFRQLLLNECIKDPYHLQRYIYFLNSDAIPQIASIVTTKKTLEKLTTRELKEICDANGLLEIYGTRGDVISYTRRDLIGFIRDAGIYIESGSILFQLDITRLHYKWMSYILEYLAIERIFDLIDKNYKLCNLKTLLGIIKYLASKSIKLNRLFKYVCQSVYFLPVYMDRDVSVYKAYMYILYISGGYAPVLMMDYKILEYLLKISDFKLKYYDQIEYTIHNVADMVKVGYVDTNMIQVCNLIYNISPSINYDRFLRSLPRPKMIAWLLDKGMDHNIKIGDSNLISYILHLYTLYKSVEYLQNILVLVDKGVYSDIYSILADYYQYNVKIPLKEILTIIYKKNPQNFIIEIKNVRFLTADQLIDLGMIIRKIVPKRIDKPSKCDNPKLSLIQNRNKISDIYRQLFNTIPKTMNNEQICDALFSYTNNINYNDIKFN